MASMRIVNKENIESTPIRPAEKPGLGAAPTTARRALGDVSNSTLNKAPPTTVKKAAAPMLNPLADFGARPAAVAKPKPVALFSSAADLETEYMPPAPRTYCRGPSTALSPFDPGYELHGLDISKVPPYPTMHPYGRPVLRPGEQLPFPEWEYEPGGFEDD